VKNTDFETTYLFLRKQLATVDFPARKTFPGADLKAGELLVPFYGSFHRVSRTGVTDMAGKEINPALGVVLCTYVLRSSKAVASEGSELVSFREFEEVGPLNGYFTENTQKLIARAFDGNIAALEQRCRLLGGRVLRSAPETAYDLSVQFDALPKIPVLLRFNDRDEAFPAQCVILFRRSAEQYLDLQCLSIAGTFLAGFLIGNQTPAGYKQQQSSNALESPC
jgi:hypothetical protein